MQITSKILIVSLVLGMTACSKDSDENASAPDDAKSVIENDMSKAKRIDQDTLDKLDRETLEEEVGVQAVSNALASKQTMEVEDFGCIRDLTPVRRFFVGNFKGNLEGTLAVANSETGGVYPPGSIVQLIPNEVMIKRDKGYNVATKDWEFIELDLKPGSTKVINRGFADVENRFGNNCFACHIQAKPEFDLVCEDTHGCDPIPVTPLMIKALQNTDPRCDPVELPPEQIEALQQLQAAMKALAAG